MREILFRGKRLDNGEWIEGDFISSSAYADRALITESKTLFDGEIREIGVREVDPSTVGQYTGLTDRNEKQIFDGDILKWDEREFGEPHFELVTWDYDLFAMRENDWSDFCVVCGNIHDNPELLEKKENKEDAN